MGGGEARGTTVTKSARLREIDYAWATTVVFSIGAAALWLLIRRAYTPWVGLVALVFDTCAISAYAVIYSYEYGIRSAGRSSSSWSRPLCATACSAALSSRSR
jgi:hypothetical protein